MNVDMEKDIDEMSVDEIMSLTADDFRGLTSEKSSKMISREDSCMKIDDNIIKKYLRNEHIEPGSEHWVYRAVKKGSVLFSNPPVDYRAHVNDCYKHIMKACEKFTFLNSGLVYAIFDDVPSILEEVNVMLVVGLPQPYDALVRTHNDSEYIILDLINISEYVLDGSNIADIITNFLSHELIHIVMGVRYPPVDFTYIENLDYIAFHEGFAHLLSYQDNIKQYQPGALDENRFDVAKIKLIEALRETDVSLQKQYLLEANSGKYWDKFASVSSMLYLMRHIDSLKEIYDMGWRGYTKQITNYFWT